MDFLTNIFSGGLLGVVTSLFSGWMKYKEVKQRNEHELAMIKVQSDASIAEIKANIEVQKTVTEGQADANENVGRSDLIKTLTGKYIKDNILEKIIDDNSLTGRIFKPFLYAHLIFMDAIRGLIRPVLTLGIVGYVAWIINSTLTVYLKDTDYTNLMDKVINPSITLLLFSASTVIGFWFADKAMTRRYQQGVKK